VSCYYLLSLQSAAISQGTRVKGSLVRATLECSYILVLVVAVVVIVADG